ncbi:hypothetical protein FAI40_03030 [Acetobacteraceae bacterium]|nr:hypothetical protein FAI40_03030 [Acetobacteraceae bacterium]
MTTQQQEKISFNDQKRMQQSLDEIALNAPLQKREELNQEEAQKIEIPDELLEKFLTKPEKMTWPTELKKIMGNEDANRVEKLEAFTSLAPELKGLLVFDELRNRFMLTREPPSIRKKSHSVLGFGESFPITFKERHLLKISEWIEATTGLKTMMKKSVIRDYLEEAGNKYRVNAIRDYLNAQRWDGIKRLEYFLALCWHLEPSEYLKEIGTRFMVASVARALVVKRPYKFDWMPVFSGTQGLGKSRFVRILFGEWAKEDISANIRDKDACQELQGNWGIEISELASLRRTSHEQAKSFLSREVDNYRPSYARDAENFPRRCVFIGTSNEERFLTDPTGNRRFMPIFIEKPLNAEWLQDNKNQLWAEAYELFKANPDFETWEPAYLKNEIAAIRERATESDILEERVQDVLLKNMVGFRTGTRWEGRTDFPLSLLSEALGNKTPSMKENKRLGTMLRKFGYIKEQVKIGEMRSWVWRKICN